MENVDFKYFDLIVAVKGFEYFSYRFDEGLINNRIHFQLDVSKPDTMLISISKDFAVKEFEKWKKILYRK